ncbi:MAG: carboxypeptidase regulatory-like domain-containing protein [Acidobacteria bacterium]|nr:carboxypeptidase regulatory-like domain-containing protein [Acidobacteriota bacterium]
MVKSRAFDNGAVVNAGAISLLSGASGGFGVISAVNSVIGTTANGGTSMNFSFDTANNQLVVGRPYDNTVTLQIALAPTAAESSVSGWVKTTTGTGMPGVLVSLSGGNLAQPMTTRTGSFGNFRFDRLPVGETFVLWVNSRRCLFDQSTRVIALFDEVNDASFVCSER